MSAPVMIDVFSDVMCPFCYLGDAELAAAIEEFDHPGGVEIRYRSFLLAPDLEPGFAMDTREYLTTRRGAAAEQLIEGQEQLAARGREHGLDFRFDRAIITSTRPAHELAHLAAEHDLQHAMMLRLFRAHFTDGENIGDREALIRLAVEVGLDAGTVAEALDSGRLAPAVQADLDAAAQLGITGVPFTVVDQRFAVSGAQPKAVYAEALRRAAEPVVDPRG